MAVPCSCEDYPSNIISCSTLAEQFNFLFIAVQGRFRFPQGFCSSAQTFEKVAEMLYDHSFCCVV